MFPGGKSTHLAPRPSVWYSREMTIPLDIVAVATEKDLAPRVLRVLSEADRALFGAPLKVSKLKRISDRHHALARLIASGKKPIEAAAMTGYTPQTVSVLKGDPAFAELVAFYREDAEREYVKLHDVIAGLSLDAFLELRRRVEDEVEKLSVNQLMEIAKLSADRSGHGPSSSQQINVNVGLADRLDAARKRMIDITPQREAAE